MYLASPIGIFTASECNVIQNSVVPVCCIQNTGGGGDPHLKTWAGTKFDFHGECDLVFLHNPAFQHGLGITIHLRTKIRRQWSRIDEIAIRVGGDTLEIQGGNQESYWVNQQEYDVTLPNTIGGFPLTYERINDKQRKFVMTLPDDQVIEIRVYKDMITVDLHGATMKDFEQSIGLVGQYGTGKMLNRDGTSELTDPIVFGQEWQVHPDDPQLFRTLTGPQYPMEQCKMPSSFEVTERHRRLSESSTKVEAAEKACEHIHDPSDFDSCVFDVLLTDDMGMVGAY
jgi:hypothetical protein